MRAGSTNLRQCGTWAGWLAVDSEPLLYHFSSSSVYNRLLGKTVIARFVNDNQATTTALEKILRR